MSDNKKIWLSPPHMGGNELRYVKEAFNTNWIAPVGPNIDLFEQKLSIISNNYHVAALTSGTAALHLALILSGVQQNDDVLCSSFTFSATANSIKYLFANPVFIDSDEDDWNMSPELLESAIKARLAINRKPKAIIVVHVYGMPAKIDDIINIANNYDIPVIEDAAEALGSTYNNQPLGVFGRFGVYSFNGNKIITTSGGGALISQKKELIKKAKYLATQARGNTPHYQHSDIGYNYRLSNISASIGLGQLEVLQERVEKKREINNYYKQQLDVIKDITFLKESNNSYSNYWLTTVLLAKDSAIDREQLRLCLEEDNIEVRPLWKPMHLQPIFKQCKSYLNGVSEDLFARGVCLPSGTNMSKEELERIIKKIKDLYEV